MKARRVRVSIVAVEKTYDICVCVCVCVFVALVIRHEKRMRRIILLPVARPALLYFSALSYKQHDFRKKKGTTRNVF
jgi:type IV secretory pathway VirB3-like protein